MNILDWCAENGSLAPAWNEEAGSVILSYTPAVTGHVPPHDTPHVTPHVALQVIAVLNACKKASSRTEIQDAIGLADREHFRKRYLLPALDAGLIERTIPDKLKTPK